MNALLPYAGQERPLPMTPLGMSDREFDAAADLWWEDCSPSEIAKRLKLPLSIVAANLSLIRERAGER